MIRLIESLNISSSAYVNALLSIVLFVIIAKTVDLLVDKVLRRFATFTDTDVDDRIIDLSQKPIFFTIIIFGALAAILHIAPDQEAVFIAQAGLFTLLAVIWCITAIKISNIVIEHSVSKVSDVTGMGSDIVPLVANVSKIVIIVAAVMIVLSLWHIDITPVVASAGIAGAAVAFAAKDTIANFFGGISVFVDKPYKMGDYIVLDKGERGEVVDIGLRSTRIRTRDDIMITIPNSIIANTKVINESAPAPNFRVRIPVGVAYGSDIDLVQQTLLEIVQGNEHIVPEPNPRVRFRAFGDSSLNFELLCWAKEPSLRGLAVHELNCSIYRKFAEKGITIPFPQQDVHIHNGQRP
jgi:MscS family membrane protein